MKKRGLIIALATAFAFTLSACTTNPPGAESGSQGTAQSEAAGSGETSPEAGGQGDSAAPGDSVKIGFCVMDLSNPFFATMVNSAQAYAKENNIELVVADGQSDAQKQVTALENFMAQGCNAIVVIPVDGESLKATVGEAVAGGIPVITHSNTTGNETLHASPDETDMGNQLGFAAASWIQENYGDQEVEYAILNQPTSPPVINREKGIIDAIAQMTPNAKCVSRVAAWLPDMGMEAAENIMQANPDVKLILGINDSGALGAYEAVKAMSNVDQSEFFIGGVDGTPESIALIASDTAFRASVDIQPGLTGQLLQEFCVEALGGKTWEEKHVIEAVAITAENVGDYQ